MNFRLILLKLANIRKIAPSIFEGLNSVIDAKNTLKILIRKYTFQLDWNANVNFFIFFKKIIIALNILISIKFPKMIYMFWDLFQ